MHVIRGYLDILAEDYGVAFSDDAQRILQRLRLSAADLTQTVENLLEYVGAISAMQATVMEEIDAAELIKELQSTFSASARRKKLFLLWRLEPQLKLIHSDRRRLLSIITNLVSNAIKFTKRGGVTVRMRRSRSNKNLVELEVADTGIGIDQRRIDDAFTAFVQLSGSNAREHRGLGLGLALVRRNVEALGAMLEVTSKPSAGSRFLVRFPESA
jgi:two-component system capsular synthesis sensor histidine kinase RcsC